MKLLMTMNLPLTRAHGGANRSNRALCEALARRGHAVRVVAPAFPVPNSTSREDLLESLRAEGALDSVDERVARAKIGGVELVAVFHPSCLRECLAAEIRSQAPDWVFVSSEDQSQSLLAGCLESAGDRIIYLAHTPQMLPFGPHALYPGQVRADLVRRACAVVTISEYMRRYVREALGCEASCIHFPHYGETQVATAGGDPDGSVLLLNASEIKGVTVFAALARAFPHHSFTAVPGYATCPRDRELLAGFPNVRWRANARRLDDLLAGVRVLVMPSLWAEGFGMAVVDAMLRGIPVLAGDYAGLREAKLGTKYLLPVNPITAFHHGALDENGLPRPVLPKQDAGPWIRALGELLSDPALYRRESDASSAAAREFTCSLSVQPLETLLRGLTRGRPCAHPPTPGQASGEAGAPANWLRNLSPSRRALLALKLGRGQSPDR